MDTQHPYVTFNFFPEVKTNISGMIHCAKSIEVGSATELFGKCLRDEIRSSIRIVEGVLDDEALIFKRHAMFLFC